METIQPGTCFAIPSEPSVTTTAMQVARGAAAGGASGHGVHPSVRTTITSGAGRRAAAASMPTRMSVPPPPVSLIRGTSAFVRTEDTGPTAMSHGITRTGTPPAAPATLRVNAAMSAMHCAKLSALIDPLVSTTTATDGGAGAAMPGVEYPGT